MKKIIATITMFGILLALLLAGCSLDTPSDPTGQVPPPTRDEATTPYVAIGNSLTAGFMDSGLMKAGQTNSYPMIVATQMGLTKDTFTQPWIEAPGIGTTTKDVPDGMIAGVLHYTGSSVVPLGLTSMADLGDLLLAAALPYQYHNLGVPGAFSHDLLTAHSASTSYAAGPPFNKPNSFFEFINRAGSDNPKLNVFGNVTIPAIPPAPSYETGSLLNETIAKGPALVTAWIGGNDFLFGATSGEPMPPSPYNALITPPAVFADNYGIFLGTLAGGLKKRNGFATPIIGATLPHVRNIAYYVDRTTFEAIFGALQLTYEEPDTEYILVPDFLGSDLTGTPQGELPANMTLDTAEVSYLDNEVIGPYNAAIIGTMGAIMGIPSAPIENLPIVDFNKLMDDLRAVNPDAARHFLLLRVMYGATESIAETAARTYFSLDGVHPNNKGYAFVANGFIDQINKFTGSTLATVPVDAFLWDPTYGVPVSPPLPQGEYPRVSPEALAAMKSGF